MNSKLIAVVVAAALACAATTIVACSDDTNSAGDAGDGGSDARALPSDAGADAALPCPLERKAEIRGRVTILDGSKTPPPAAGARVCIHGRADLPCVESLADGTYEHTCVPEGDVGILFSKDGVGRMLALRVMTAGIAQELEGKLATTDENKKLFAPVGVTYPRPGRGLVTLNETHDMGYAFTVTPLAAGVDGPFYSADGEKIDRTADAGVGLGYVFMAAPIGELQIGMAAADGGTCQQVLGGWGSKDGKITVPVLEDTETFVFVRCP